jgi:hypothetical protein
MMCPPHLEQNWRSLIGVVAKVETYSSPAVTFTASGFHKLNALTGPADQDLHDLQWQ